MDDAAQGLDYEDPPEDPAEPIAQDLPDTAQADEQPAAEAPVAAAAEPEPMTADAPAEAKDAADAKAEAGAKAAEPGAGDAKDPMSQPPHGTEVYAANIDHSASEEQIRAFFDASGEVVSLRVPRHPTGGIKGFAFIVYRTREQAAAAVAALDQSEMQDFPGRNVKVVESQVKNRLFIGNLPKHLTTEEVLEVLRKHAVGVEDLDLMKDRDPESSGFHNRGFGFVSFYNHATAEQARRRLDNSYIFGNRHVTVTWADPKRGEEGDKDKVRALWVGNLPASATDEKLAEVFKAYGEVEKAVLPPAREGEAGTHRGYGFVHFAERAGALAAYDATRDAGPDLDGTTLHVAMAKPMADHRGGGDAGGGGGGGGGGYGGGGGGYGGGGRGGGGYVGPRGGGGGGYGGGYGGGGGGYNDYDYEEGGDYGGDYGGGGARGFGFPAAGGMALVPVVLPNGQMGYMLNPGAAAAAAMMGGMGGAMRRAAGGGGAYGGYGGVRGGGGGGGGYGGGRGYGRGGGSGQGRYHPY